MQPKSNRPEFIWVTDVNCRSKCFADVRGILIFLMHLMDGWLYCPSWKSNRTSGGNIWFKHVCPAGAAAVGLPLSDTLAKVYWVDDLEVVARWRTHMQGRSRQNVFVRRFLFSLSDVCDVDTAKLIKRSSDGVIAPGYEPEALEILKQKKGNYNIIEIDPWLCSGLGDIRKYSASHLNREEMNWILIRTSSLMLLQKTKEIPEQAKIDLCYFHDHFEIHSQILYVM